MTTVEKLQESAPVGHDLSACDREPIHLSGAIQPHGLLLIVDAATFRTVAGAGDLEARLASDWLDRPISELIGQDLEALLRSADMGPGGTLRLAPVVAAGGTLEASLHRSGDMLIVELEPQPETSRPAIEVLVGLERAAATFERAADLVQLCERAAVAFRQLTGFDRVMLYRFLDDGAGVVLAEDRAPGRDSFLNHHFPASDIPRQARALYVRNRVRVIPDAGYTPAPIRPESANQGGIDLSDVALRSVSPIHLQYLRNMGVEASASISIVRDGVLWGLVACHHDSPRRMGPELRAAARALAGGLARQIRAQEEAESYRERLRLHAGEDLVIARLGGEQPIRVQLAQCGKELAELLDADGFALVCGDTVSREGHCPDDADLLRLAEWVNGQGGGLVVSRELSTPFPPAERYAGVGSGLLGMPIDGMDCMAMWFRMEEVERVNWAGNPHKAVEVEPGAVLTPRASFESWSQIVRGRARRWTLEEVKAAHRLRGVLHDLRQRARLRELNGQLSEANREQELLLRQKDVLMHEVNHRVQNSLQLVSAFLGMQARAVDDATLTSHLTEAQARLSAVALVHRRLYRDDQVEAVELSRYLDELMTDMRASLGKDWGSALRVYLAPVLVPTGRAVDIGLITTELVINATKYAYPGTTGPITVMLEQHRANLRLIVEDQGRGKSGAGEGFGSRMMKALVGRLGGELAFEDNAPGLRVILTAPIEESGR
ncbi:histidine kinase dimerization/phosphoacceptor domain -containing protein [Sphingomonas desiccabilis]|uniref:histidine kinase n=1 Tax=Sphingomonas desiccabilis TaxID=429134 RepID=A0A4Q2IPU2_9SPHN|nr:histidine kinase dimerization/phosphoacceptor domain -containing protein [Sphingomonas desiccabilis]MBB3911675.1 light-regulated signal transduction histidine kinase (bacteriophytochrome) [Sphingomonas desiccabilis]RXZ31592.1 GAF domain-containing protein [Sphingomonas desiccabilis]